jgi:hypothetical protein
MRANVTGLVVAALVSAFIVSACDSTDPTAQSFAIGFRNDAQRPLELRSCRDDGCRDFPDTWNLDPGETAKDNISDRKSITWWRVFDMQGRSLGCLPMVFDGKYDDVVVKLSQAEPCAAARPITADHVAHGARHARA